MAVRSHRATLGNPRFCVLALLALFWQVMPVQWRRPLAALGGFVIVAVGVGRVALNVHHPSDVLAGWALGYAYFILYTWPQCV